MKVDMVKPLKRRQPHMPRSTFISKSQAKKKAKADSMLVDQSIKEAMMHEYRKCWRGVRMPS